MNLPADLVIEILVHLSPKDVLSLLRTSTQYQSDYYLTQLITRKYHLNLNLFPGKTTLEKYTHFQIDLKRINWMAEDVVKSKDPQQITLLIDLYGATNGTFEVTLHEAAKSGDLSIVEVTLQALLGKISPSPSAFQNAVFWAAECRYREIFDYLMKYYPYQRDRNFLRLARFSLTLGAVSLEYLFPYLPRESS